MGTLPDNSLRTFIAIELPLPLRQYLAEIGHQLAHHHPPHPVRWVKPERMHLTLRFLGTTAETQLAPLCAAIDALTAEYPPFSLTLGRLGGFPNRQRPRVIWIGLGGQLSALNALVQQLDARLLALGWPPEKKPFKPHLTLGRINDSRLLHELNWELAIEPKRVAVSAVALFESQLTRSGPIYIRRHTSTMAT